MACVPQSYTSGASHPPTDHSTRLTAFFRNSLDKLVPGGQTILDFTGAEMMGLYWHQLDHVQVICTSLQTDSHASTASLSCLQATCSSYHPANSIKALKAVSTVNSHSSQCDSVTEARVYRWWMREEYYYKQLSNEIILSQVVAV